MTAPILHQTVAYLHNNIKRWTRNPLADTNGKVFDALLSNATQGGNHDGETACHVRSPPPPLAGWYKRAHKRQFWVFRGYKKCIRQGAAARTAAQLGTGAEGGGPGVEEQSGSEADVRAKQTQVQAGTGLSTHGGAATAWRTAEWIYF